MIEKCKENGKRCTLFVLEKSECGMLNQMIMTTDDDEDASWYYLLLFCVVLTLIDIHVVYIWYMYVFITSIYIL